MTTNAKGAQPHNPADTGIVYDRLNPRDYIHILDISDSVWTASKSIRAYRKAKGMNMHYIMDFAELQNAIALSKFKDEL